MTYVETLFVHGLTCILILRLMQLTIWNNVRDPESASLESSIKAVAPLLGIAQH